MLPIAIALVATVAGATPAAPDAFDEAALGAALWRDSPELVAARGLIVDAAATQHRATLYLNPTLNGTWATIPIGTRNPADTPFADVPSYSVGASQQFELGKRGPRAAAARAGAEEARLVLGDLFRARFLDLLRAIGEQAIATGHASILERLVADSEETLRLQKLRAAHGDVAGLEVDRLEVEHLRLLSSLGEARASAEAALAACAVLLGSSCPHLDDLEQALRYLGGPALPDGDGEEANEQADDQAILRRPDLQALQAAERRARAEGLLAERHRIPDPTLSAGFTRDEFVASGNQANSVTLSLAVPLPLFDHGQPEATRAAARAALAARQREKIAEGARSALLADRRRLAILGERARRLDEQAIPMARTTAERLEAAARRGGAALQDVLLARRAMEELQMDRVDVAGQSFSARLEIRRAAGAVPEPAGGFR